MLFLCTWLNFCWLLLKTSKKNFPHLISMCLYPNWWRPVSTTKRTARHISSAYRPSLNADIYVYEYNSNLTGVALAMQLSLDQFLWDYYPTSAIGVVFYYLFHVLTFDYKVRSPIDRLKNCKLSKVSRFLFGVCFKGSFSEANLLYSFLFFPSTSSFHQVYRNWIIRFASFLQ